MPETTSQAIKPCPLRNALEMIGGKWKLPVLCLLSSGEALRYSTIKRNVGGITNMMLSQSLKELEANGIVKRVQYNEVPPRVEYSLTEAGQSLLPALNALARWGADNGEGFSDENCKACHASFR